MGGIPIWRYDDAAAYDAMRESAVLAAARELAVGGSSGEPIHFTASVDGFVRKDVDAQLDSLGGRGVGR